MVFKGFVLFISALSLTANAWAVSVPTEDAVTEINLQTASDRKLILEISSDAILKWYEDIRHTRLIKEDRLAFDKSLYNGFLPDEYKITYTKFPDSLKIKPRLTLEGPLIQHGGSAMQQNYTLAQGLDMWAWDNEVLPELVRLGTSIAEQLRSKDVSTLPQFENFPTSVPVQVKEIKLSIAEPKTDIAALDVKFLVNAKNIADLADYFGTGYERESVLLQLQKELGTKTEAWIDLKQILQGWPAKWVNRFPKEKSDEDGVSANDVCHGTARQFFSDTLLNSSMDRSTEATEWLLRTSYTLLEDGSAPQFGDYLYRPGIHSIRFILRDPASGRWIGFSSYSSWTTPYRVWWVDQDYYSANNYPPPPQIPGSESTFDVWRIRR